MRATYGAAFDRQWECPADVEPEKHVAGLKAVWGRELRGFQQNPRAIAHALDHLPADFPPNLLQFAALCRRAPQFHVQERLPAPKADQAVIAQVLEAVRPELREARAWIPAMQRRLETGDNLTITQRTMLAAAKAGGSAA